MRNIVIHELSKVLQHVLATKHYVTHAGLKMQRVSLGDYWQSTRRCTVLRSSNRSWTSISTKQLCSVKKRHATNTEGTGCAPAANHVHSTWFQMKFAGRPIACRADRMKTLITVIVEIEVF